MHEDFKKTCVSFCTCYLNSINLVPSASHKTIPKKEKFQTTCIKSLEIRTRNVEADTFLTNTFAQLSVCMAAKFKCCGERKIVTEPQGFTSVN